MNNNNIHPNTYNNNKQVLPTYSGKAGDGEPLLESLIWLLLTSEVPTKEQVDTLTKELHERSSKLPSHVIPLLNSLPKDMHPMTQFSIGLNAAQTASTFAKAYGESLKYYVCMLVYQLDGSSLILIQSNTTSSTNKYQIIISILINKKTKQPMVYPRMNITSTH